MFLRRYIKSYTIVTAASLVLFAIRATAEKMPTFHELKGTDIDGNELSFSKFKNKVVYVTNVASA